MALIAILLLTAGIAVHGGSSTVRLPQVDGTVAVDGLHSDVTVNATAGAFRTFAPASAEDMAESQGYVIAQDRLWQMDLLRRAALGELSEIFGPDALPLTNNFAPSSFAAPPSAMPRR